MLFEFQFNPGLKLTHFWATRPANKTNDKAVSIVRNRIENNLQYFNSYRLIIRLFSQCYFRTCITVNKAVRPSKKHWNRRYPRKSRVLKRWRQHHIACRYIIVHCMLCDWYPKAIDHVDKRRSAIGWRWDSGWKERFSYYPWATDCRWRPIHLHSYKF